ncbi:MAG: hypothetical protein ABSA68_13795 [Xanthobacteraceae bacterium]|jgi:hypothetical protein
MAYAIFLCLHYSASAPQLDNCQILRVNGEAMYYQSAGECKKTAAILNARAAAFQKWVCMAKPGWQPAQ